MKPYRKLALLPLLIAILMATAGCTKHIRPPKNALDDPAKLRAATEARLDQVDDARFKEVVLDYFGKGKRVKVRQLILVARPRSLRVQTRLPGTNEVMSVLATDGQTFAMHKRDTNEYFTGRPSPKNISRLLPVDLSAADVVRVMLGGAPWDRFDRGSGPASLAWDDTTGRYEYARATADGGRLSMQVRPADYAVVSVTETDADDQLTYKYTTDDWARHETLALPDYRRFVWPSRDLDFSIDVGETQVDPHMNDGLFELLAPPGSTVIHVDGR